VLETECWPAQTKSGAFIWSFSEESAPGAKDQKSRERAGGRHREWGDGQFRFALEITRNEGKYKDEKKGKQVRNSHICFEAGTHTIGTS